MRTKNRFEEQEKSSKKMIANNMQAAMENLKTLETREQICWDTLIEEMERLGLEVRKREPIERDDLLRMIINYRDAAVAVVLQEQTADIVVCDDCGSKVLREHTVPDMVNVVTGEKTYICSCCYSSNSNKIF